MGDTKGGPFVVEEAQAKRWIGLANPHGRSNAEVLVRWINGLDITRRDRCKWIVDFGVDRSEQDAAFFEAPFEYAKLHVLPERKRRQREIYSRLWWLHLRPRAQMRKALAELLDSS